MMTEEVKELVKWPTDRDGMTIDLMLRTIGVDTQFQFLSKMKEMNEDFATAVKTPLYHARTLAIISGVGLMQCIRAFRKANPDAAQEFVRDYFELCEDGGEFGPALWEWLEEAGLNPELLKLEEPPSVAAVDPVAANSVDPSTRA